MTMPNGICPKCNKPIDDHDWSVGVPLCKTPKVTA